MRRHKIQFSNDAISFTINLDMLSYRSKLETYTHSLTRLPREWKTLGFLLTFVHRFPFISFSFYFTLFRVMALFSISLFHRRCLVSLLQRIFSFIFASTSISCLLASLSFDFVRVCVCGSISFYRCYSHSVHSLHTFLIIFTAFFIRRRTRFNREKRHQKKLKIRYSQRAFVRL